MREPSAKARVTKLPKPPRETPAFMQSIPPVKCPYCGACGGTDRPRLKATCPRLMVRYYKCRTCDLDGTGGTDFKVSVAEAPEIPPEGHQEEPDLE